LFLKQTLKEKEKKEKTLSKASKVSLLMLDEKWKLKVLRDLK